MAFSTDSRTTDQIFMKLWLTGLFSQREHGTNLNATYKRDIRSETTSVHLIIRVFNTWDETQEMI